MSLGTSLPARLQSSARQGFPRHFLRWKELDIDKKKGREAGKLVQSMRPIREDHLRLKYIILAGQRPVLTSYLCKYFYTTIEMCYTWQDVSCLSLMRIYFELCTSPVLIVYCQTPSSANLSWNIFLIDLQLILRRWLISPSVILSVAINWSFAQLQVISSYLIRLLVKQ